MIKKTDRKHKLTRFSDLNERFFILEFCYNINDDEYYAFIGIFSTEEKANQAVDILLTRPGFENYSRDNFIIGPNLIDLLYWDEGFIKVYC